MPDVLNTFQGWLKAAEDFQKDTDSIIVNHMVGHESDIIELNTEKQLFEKGIDSAGKKITPPYRPLTIRMKRAKGQPTNRVTLQDTGAFHRSFYLTKGKDFVEINARDPKTKKLLVKYGEDVKGLTPDSRDKLVDIMRPGFQSGFKKRFV